jgi:hypothetical protein
MEVLKSVIINILLMFIRYCLFLEGHAEHVLIHVAAPENPWMLRNHFHRIWVKAATSKISAKNTEAPLTMNVGFTLY